MVRRILHPASILNQSQFLVGYDRSMRILQVFPCLLGILRHQTCLFHQFTIIRLGTPGRRALHAQMSGHSWLFCGTGEGIMPPEDLRRQVAASMGTVISRGRAPLHRRGHQAPRRLTQNQIKCSTGH